MKKIGHILFALEESVFSDVLLCLEIQWVKNRLFCTDLNELKRHRWAQKSMSECEEAQIEK